MKKEYDSLRRLAADIRIQTIRQMREFGAGHIGGCMSVADVLAVLYGRVLRYRANEPDWPDRDLLVMSKGHTGPALYAALALSGFFPMDMLDTLNKGGSRLPSHCDRLKTPGIDASTGSLGQGISLACGFALGNRMKKKDVVTYAILGDGELQEGQVWEAVQFAAHRALDRLVIIVDNNGAQLDGKVEQISRQFDLRSKFDSFGCRTHEAIGYDVEQISGALTAIRDRETECDRPQVLILNTRKGIGCLFAERAALNHHMPVSREDADEAIAEIERRLQAGLFPGGECA